MSTVPTPDVHDVSNCPIGFRCESDGLEADDLAVTTVATPLGVYCVTLCARCLASGIPPHIALSTAVNLIAQHSGHDAESPAAGASQAPPADPAGPSVSAR